MSLPGDWRARVEQYVRPLYTELDGVETFSRVERLEERVADLAVGAAHDPRRLELLILFHGVVDRLGSLANGGRWQLFLRGLGLAPAEIAALRAGLERYAGKPRTLEEELLHDAVMLERCGIEAALDRLLAAGRRRIPLDRALAQLDPGPEPERFRLAAGRRLAAQRYAAAERWIAGLRVDLERERGGEGRTPSDPAGNRADPPGPELG
jgi:hypothetical protein